MSEIEIEARREAAVQAMIGKGYTRERAEHLLFGIVGGTLFGPGGRFANAAACTTCSAGDVIIDPISQNEEPHTCPDCGGSGKAQDQVHRGPA